jgi:hypothetical protein
MIHFSTFPDQAISLPEFNINTTITSQSGRYYSATTAAPVWAGVHTRTAPTGSGWLRTMPACEALAETHSKH